LPQGLRCGRAALGSRGGRRRNADPGRASKRRWHNARVAPRGHLARGGIRRREPQDAAPAASADSAEDVAELLDDFLIGLLELPGDTWPDLAAALPDELFDRIDRWMEVRFVP
jgi:hypothetical protein